MRVCKGCKLELGDRSFPKHSYSGTVRRRWFCRDCHNTRLRNSLKWRVTSILKQARRRAIAKNLPFTISRDWVKYRIENGVCELSGVEFVLSGTKKHPEPRAPSIERIDAHLGYTEENCRIIALCLNHLFNAWGEARSLEVVLRYVKERNATLADSS